MCMWQAQDHQLWSVTRAVTRSHMRQGKEDAPEKHWRFGKRCMGPKLLIRWNAQQHVCMICWHSLVHILYICICLLNYVQTSQEDDVRTLFSTACNLMTLDVEFGWTKGRFGSGGSEADRVGRAQVTYRGGTEVLFRAGGGPSADRRKFLMPHVSHDNLVKLPIIHCYTVLPGFSSDFCDWFAVLWSTVSDLSYVPWDSYLEFSFQRESSGS